jgi:hypothetical protein
MNNYEKINDEKINDEKMVDIDQWMIIDIDVCNIRQRHL